MDPNATPLSRTFAVILAGGSGTRLWPLSRALSPKQFLALKGDSSLLQETLERTLTLFPPDRIIVVTNEENRFEVANHIEMLDCGPGITVLPEPLRRNTLPAILLALDHIDDSLEHGHNGPAPLLAVFPSDHVVLNQKKWAESLTRGADLAGQGCFVTFGMEIRHPETGYGYIARGAELGDSAFQVAGFVEKPDMETAEKYHRDGEHFWNSGMFLLPADKLLDAVHTHEPDLAAWWDERSETPLVRSYGKIPGVSVDYGVMERVDSIAVVASDFGWDDLGSWEALYRLARKDTKDVAQQGDVLALGCSKSLLVSTSGKLAAIGLDNIIAVQTRDATLICSLDQVQKVKDVVELLKSQGSPLVESHLTVRRPWGSYTVLEEGPHYKIKRIEVLPGAKLSLQMHHHRSEHWVVISGTAEVQVGEDVMLLSENQAVDIPKASKHRLANPGKVPVEIIEIQSGPYLEEDDIVRFDDVYGR